MRQVPNQRELMKIQFHLLGNLRNSVKTILIILLVSTTSLVITGPSIRNAYGASNMSTNSYDTYTQHWTGLRPLGNREIVDYNQRAMSVASDSSASAQLTVEMNYLHNGDGTSNLPDQTGLGFILNANSRLEIQYSKSGPSSFSGPIAIPSNAVDTGIHCSGSCGAWVTLSPTLVYYGAPIRSGNYDQVWVCVDGYVSLVQDTNCTNSSILGPGMIAPFSRSLWMDSSSHIWYWSAYNPAGGYDTYIAWDQMQDGSILHYQDRESFVLWIHDSSFSSNGNSNIQFFYNSINPNNGMYTVVGIADQFGKNTATFDPTTLASNQYVAFTEQNTLRYLNSLSVSITDTSNGVTDSNAKVVFDPTQNPVTYNMLQQSTIADSSTLLPGWAKLTMDGAGVATGVYAATGLVLATTVGAGGLLLGGAALGIDTYDLMIHSYWDPKLMTQRDQTGPGDATPAQIRATGSQGGSTSGLIYLPVDASLGAKLIWAFYDTGRNVPHHLSVAATVGYTDSAYAGVDTWSVTTNVDLDVKPDYELVADNFEAGILSPLSTPNGADAWTVTTSCPQFNSQPNCYQGNFVAFGKETFNLNDQAVLNLGSLVNYNQIVANLHLWIDAGGPETLYIEYYSQGAWTTATSYNARVSTTGYRAKTASTQWINPVIVLPTSATMLRFRFGLPPGVTCCGTYGTGVYLDDMYIFGDGAGNSAQVTINSQTATGIPIAAPIFDSDGFGAYYLAPVNVLEPIGTTHTFQAWNFVDNTGTYAFQKWSDGSQANIRQFSVTQNMQLTVIYTVVPDFTLAAYPSTVTINTASSQSESTIIVVTSRNGFSGQISLTASVSPNLVVGGYNYGIQPSFDYSNVQVTPSSQGRATLTFTNPTGGPVPQTYNVTVTGTGGQANSLSYSIYVTVNVVYAPPSGGGGSGGGGGGGGGSLSPGTLIVMADGSQVPVQNVNVGESVVAINVYTGKQTIATITQVQVVTVDSKLTIYADSGLPFRTDANPLFRLHVMRNGQVTLMPVTEIHPGDMLFSYYEMSWISVTGVTVNYGGSHTVYDLTISPQSVDFIANGYADACKGCKL